MILSIFIKILQRKQIISNILTDSLIIVLFFFFKISFYLPT